VKVEGLGILIPREITAKSSTPLELNESENLFSEFFFENFEKIQFKNSQYKYF